MPDEAEELQTIMSNVQQDFARLQRHHGIKTGAKEAQRANARLAQLEAINEKAPRGVLATGIVTGKGAADLMGLSTEVLGLKKDATAVEVLQSLGQPCRGQSFNSSSRPCLSSAHRSRAANKCSSS